MITDMEYESFMQSVFPSLTDAIIVFSIAIFICLIFFGLFKASSISAYLESVRIKERKKAHGEVTNKKSSDFIDQLSKMVEDILENDGEKEISFKARNKIRGTSLPLKYKVKKALKDMMTNPYNPVAVPKMILLSGAFSICGFGLGVFLENIVFCISLAVVGLVAPIIFVSVASLSNQMKILQSNLGLMASHLGIYKESNSIADSFRSLINVLTPDSREYKAIFRAHGAIIEANIDLYDVMERLKADLLADLVMCQYLDLCYISDTKSAEYKDALDYLPKRLEPIVMKNLGYTAMVKLGFVAYIVCAGILISTLFYYKFMEPSTFQFFSGSVTGQVISFSLLCGYILIGIMFTKISNLLMM